MSGATTHLKKDVNWTAPAEKGLAGGIFSDVSFQPFAPQRLESPAAAVQGIHPGKIGVIAQQVAEANPGGCLRCF